VQLRLLATLGSILKQAGKTGSKSPIFLAV